MEQKYLKARLIPKKGQRVKALFRCPVPENLVYHDVYRGEGVYYVRRFAIIQGGEKGEILEVIYVEEELF